MIPKYIANVIEEISCNSTTFRPRHVNSCRSTWGRIWSHNKWLCSVARMHTQSPPTLCIPVDYSPPGSSAHGIFHGKNTGVGCHFLLQGNFLTQGLNPRLLSLLLCKQILYHCTTWEAATHSVRCQERLEDSCITDSYVRESECLTLCHLL